MGQRHQAFVIARVRPYGSSEPKYRCIAAYHHQWCYGRLPLQAMRRFLTLVRQKDNADIVRTEVHNMHDKYGRFGESPEVPDVPCPFTAWLLGATWCTGVLGDGRPYLSGMTFTSSVLPANMASWGGHNDDGISIIDVTDPESPAYCFMLSHRPISATAYVRTYYPERGEDRVEDEQDRALEADVIKTIHALDGERMVTAEMLAEAWQHEYNGEANSTGYEQDDDGRGSGEAYNADIHGPGTSVVPPLAILSLKPALIHAIENDDTSRLEEMLWLPGKAEQVMSLLRDCSPFPDGAVSLLVKACTYTDNKATMNLSGFDISLEQLLQALSALHDLQSLDLSFNVHISVDGVRSILAASPAVKRLVLMGCTSIVDSDLFHLMHSEPQLSYRLDALLHPALLQATEPPPYPIGFTFAATFDFMWPRVRGCVLPLFTPTNIALSFLEFCKTLWQLESYDYDRDGAMLAQATFTAMHVPGRDWGERSINAVPVFATHVFTGKQPGWALVFDYNAMRKFGYPLKDKYVFLRCKPARAEGADVDAQTAADASGTDGKAISPRIDYEMFDLRGFLRATAEEGRPPVAEDTLAKLEEFFYPEADATDEDEEKFMQNLEPMFTGDRSQLPEPVFKPPRVMKQEEVDRFLKAF